MHVGVTGSSHGATIRQKRWLWERLRELREADARQRFHHGDCIGVDAQAAEMALRLGYVVVSHPPVNQKAQAHFPSHVVNLPKPYLERNADIAAACDILLACPDEPQEVVRSGTWATVRYARKRQKRVEVCIP